MYSKIIDAYIREHKSNYQAKYCYHSCDRVDTRIFKFHYYIRDAQLLQMNIFLDIHLEDEVKVYFKEDIHEHEQWAIACDALERIRAYTNRKTTLSPEEMAEFIQKGAIKSTTSPQDMINTLNYIQYHHGKNPDSVYSFYALFIPYLENRIANQKFKEVLTACNMLFENILYETIWHGYNIKYLDQEHFMHHAYARTILNLIYLNFKTLVKEEFDAVVELMLQIFHHWRFAFAIYSSLEKFAVDYPQEMMALLMEMNESCHESSLDGCCLVYDTILALATNDEKEHRESVIEVLKLLMTDILSLANPEDQKQTGLIFLKMVGFDLLIEIFDQTKDSYVYSCFSVEDIPSDFHPFIKQQLEEALQYYASLMKDAKKRMEAIDQIANINTLLIEHFNVY